MAQAISPRSVLHKTCISPTYNYDRTHKIAYDSLKFWPIHSQNQWMGEVRCVSLFNAFVSRNKEQTPVVIHEQP